MFGRDLEPGESLGGCWENPLTPHRRTNHVSSKYTLRFESIFRHSLQIEIPKSMICVAVCASDHQQQVDFRVSLYSAGMERSRRRATGIPLAGWTEGAFFSEDPLGPLRQTSVCQLICPPFAKEMFT